LSVTYYFNREDGWRSITKESVNAVCVTVDYLVYTVELVEATALDKTGEGFCQQFSETIDRIETRFNCSVTFLVTDADGGSNKGRKLLGKQRPYLVLPSCWGHQVSSAIIVILLVD